MTARVLIVDDNPANRKLLEVRLTTEYFEVLTESNGPDAIAMCEKSMCDIVLLDVMMPGKSGWEVARALKQDPVTANVKIVMVSAIGEKTNEITAPIYGADGHVDKPFEFEHLEGVISKLLA